MIKGLEAWGHIRDKSAAEVIVPMSFCPEIPACEVSHICITSMLVSVGLLSAADIQTWTSENYTDLNLPKVYEDYTHISVFMVLLDDKQNVLWHKQ